MNIGFESALVAIFLVLPGFLTTILQRSITNISQGKDDEAGTTATWAAVSLLRSLAMNAIATPLYFVASSSFSFEDTFFQIQSKLNDLPLSEFSVYLGCLYTLALVFGVILGLQHKIVTLHRWLHIQGWTSVTPNPNVWNAAIDSFFKAREVGINRQHGVPWVQVQVTDNRIVAGRLQRGNVSIQQDKAFEIFLTQSYEIIDGEIVLPRTQRGFDCLGTYLRVTEQMPVHLFNGPENWDPADLPWSAPVRRTSAGGFTIVDDAVMCRGPADGSPHPGVYITAGPDGLARCPYCESIFALGSASSS